jgi:hypothetical protein
MPTNSHLSLQVNIAVFYPLNITTRSTHVVTSSITGRPDKKKEEEEDARMQAKNIL